METLTVREAAEFTGLSAHTLRYYERAGLLTPIARNASGHRRYARADLEHLGFLHCLRASGMPIRRMQEYAALAREGRASLPDRLALLESHRQDTVQQLEDIQRSLEKINHKIARFQQVIDDPTLADTLAVGPGGDARSGG